MPLASRDGSKGVMRVFVGDNDIISALCVPKRKMQR